MNGLFTLTWANVRSAVVYGLLTLISMFLLSVLQSVLNAGSIFGLDWRHTVDSAVIATIPALIVMVSIGKNLLTDNSGKFLGITKVIPDNEPTPNQ
jgi:hypothetical protein